MRKLSLLFALCLASITFAAQQPVNVGTSANDHTGDPARTAFIKLNANDTELYGKFPVMVPNGGIGATTLTAHGLLLGQGTSNVSALAALAADTLVQGQGVTSDPASVAVPNCGSSTQALSYSTTTHTFGCQSITAGSAALTSTQIGVGNGSNLLGGNSDFTFSESTHTLTIGGSTGATTIQSGAQSNSSSGGLSIIEGANTFFASPAPLLIQGSNGSGVGVGGGGVTIAAGTSASSTPGSILLQTSGATKVTIDINGLVTLVNGMRLTNTTVASLPTCNSGAKGDLYAVSDATSPTYNATVTGGGSVSVPVYCNGSNWTTH